MRKYLILLFLCLFTATYGQKHSTLEINTKSCVKLVSTTEVDSIIHHDTHISLYKYNAIIDSIDYSDIDSISFLNSNKLYQLDKAVLDDWDAGVISYNNDQKDSSIYILGSFDPNAHVYITHLNKISNNTPEEGISIYCDENHQIQKVYVNGLCYLAHEVEGVGILFTGIDKNGKIVDTFELSHKKASRYSRSISVFDIFNLGLDGSGIINMLDHFGKSEYEEIALSITKDIVIGTLFTNPFDAFIAKVSIDLLDKMYFQLIRNDLYDGCEPQIVDIQKDYISVKVSGIENLRDYCLDMGGSQGTSKEVYLIIGVNEGNDYVTYKKSDKQTPPTKINNKQAIYEIPFSLSDLQVGTYYIKPMLVANQVFDMKYDVMQERCVQYGETQQLKYPNIKLIKGKKNECSYIEGFDEYALDISIDAEIDYIENVSTWGIRIYNPIGIDEEITIPVSSNKTHTFNLRKIIPANYFNKGKLSLQIFPFAIGTNPNDEVYCQAASMNIEAEDGIITSWKQNSADYGWGNETDGYHKVKFETSVKANVKYLNNVEEWGAYIIKEDGWYIYPAKSNTIKEDWIDINFFIQRDDFDSRNYNTFSAQSKVQIGVYKKIKDSSGEYYVRSTPQEFELNYNEKPSVKYVSSVITGTDIISVETDENGNEIIHYKTYFQDEVAIKGSFWIDHLLWNCEGNNWNPIDSHNWYISKDKTYSTTHSSTYTNHTNLEHIVYYDVYLCDGSVRRSDN